MKSSNTLSNIIAAALLLGVLVLGIVMSRNVKDKDEARDLDVSDAAWAQTLEDFAVSDSALAQMQQEMSETGNLPQTQMPVLTIGGKENADVYLQSLDIAVEVTGNIASTRYTMVFKNKTNRILEGELTFPLPDGRTATHYALDINGKMRDAVPVEKARATQVFEEIQRRQVDPGILERVEGNNFRTRIYPFPRNGTRTISIGYEEELTLENGLLYYRLPMAYASPLENFAVKASVLKGGQKPIVPKSENELQFDATDENYVAAFERQNYKPSHALIFALPAPADIPQIMMQSAQNSFYFLASVAPKIETRKKQWGDNLAIIWDVSLSGSERDLKREMEVLNTVFTEKKNVRINLYFLNNRFQKKGEYRVTNGNWSELKKVLETAVFDGGTDFSQINIKDITGDEVLFFSDGLSTLSDADFIKNAKVDRPIHCIVSSSKSDYNAMKMIAGKTRGKFVNLNALSSEKLNDELLNETLQFLGTEHGNAVREVYPSITTPVHGNFSVAGISNGADTELTLLFGFGNKVERRIKVRLDTKRAARQGNIYRIWAQKKIAELDLNYEKNQAELTELGQQFGIVTRNTSLMVLELISDYVQFNIEPPATEPKLLAEYQRRVRERRDQQRNTESTLFSAALGSVQIIKKWWDTDFTPQHPKPPKQPKYPVPDNQLATNMMENLPATQKITPSKSSGSMTGGGGDPKARVTQMGVLGTVSGQIKGKSVASADIFGKGGFATDIDAILSGVGGLKSGGDGGVGRKGTAGIGYGSGFGGGGNGIDDLLSGLMSGGKSQSSPQQPTITIKHIRKDSDYLKKLTGKLVDDYKTYLSSRNDYINSPTFYFDMADWFFKHNDRETALRILTSVAELEIENALLYRLLGYRFKEYGEYTLQKFVCQKVIQWRPIEPQSYRDYALALADNGETQAALDSLNSLLKKPFSASIINRSKGLEEVVVTEINHLIAKNPRLNTSKIDRRLLTKVPVDVRTVINWNTDNVIIDMYIKDPTGEECYYANRHTRIGGRLSADNMSGYGPEQFMLKKAMKGKYQIFVDYYGNRDIAAAGPSTIMVEIYTKYADKSEQRRVVTLQLSEAKGQLRNDRRTLVAEFDY